MNTRCTPTPDFPRARPDTDVEESPCCRVATRCAPHCHVSIGDSPRMQRLAFSDGVSGRQNECHLVSKSAAPPSVNGLFSVSTCSVHNEQRTQPPALGGEVSGWCVSGPLASALTHIVTFVSVKVREGSQRRSRTALPSAITSVTQCP